MLEQLTVLDNVVLALSFSHYSNKMRVKLAREALEHVGLLNEQNKYPSEISGGQMQCVAIARSIVKNPDIILADEPTGSLDSKSSKLIMDVLKNVGKNRIVIVATHNDALAKQYSTKIYDMKDGVLSSSAEKEHDDSAFEEKPILANDQTSATKILNNNKIKTGHNRLSLSSAIHLAFRSLSNKKLKTFAMLAAGCVGVFLVATILSVSNGINQYIKTMQDTTFAQYPVVLPHNRDLNKVDSYVKVSEEEANKIQNEKITKAEQRKKVLEEAKRQHRVALNNVIGAYMSTGDNTSTLSKVSTVNDLYSLKQFLDKNPNDINNDIMDLEYTFRTAPVLFSANSNGIKEVYPNDGMFGSLGSGSGKASSDGSSSKSGTSSAFGVDKLFSEIGPLPRNADLYKDDESLVAGHWPNNPYECLLVLKTDGTIDDTMLYTLGLRDFQSEIAPLIEKYKNNEKVDYPGQLDTYSYNEFLGTSLKVVNPSDCYKFVEDRGI